jgi:branched-chain amino acid transport system permease protein
MTLFVDYTLNGITFGMLYAAMALALVLIWRATRVINFAQGALGTLSTYIAASIIDRHASYWWGFVAALVAGAAMGGLTERLLVRPVERKSALAPVIVTIGVLIALEALAGIIWGGEFRSFPAYFSQLGIKVGHHRLAFSPFDIFVLASVVVVLAGLVVLFRFTETGLRLRASAFAPEVARLLGVRVGQSLVLGWALASVVGALVALLVAPKILLYPDNMEGVLIFGFTAAVIGGLDSPVGAVVGGIVTGLVISYVGGYLGPSLETIGALAVLIVVLSTRPEGLFSRAAARRV